MASQIRERTGAPSHSPIARRVPFGDVLCAVDGSRRGFEAVAQAATLAGTGARLSLISVPWRNGLGMTEMTDLTPSRAQHALDHARELAQALGATVVAETLEPGDSAASVILAQAAGHALLAVGAPTVTRARGKLLGSVASSATHFLPASLLLAREAPGRFRFPRRILVASDGMPESDGLVDVAAVIARGCDGRVTLLHASGDEPAERRQRCARQAARLFEAMDVEPIFRSEKGRAHDVLISAARAEEMSLIVMGSRRLAGLRALGSISERVAHHAPCSVLVVRPQDGDDSS
jgi:nucleotide-binding universal stress UspA family protein